MLHMGISHALDRGSMLYGFSGHFAKVGGTVCKISEA